MYPVAARVIILPLNSGVEKLVSRRVHAPKVGGSSPLTATNILNIIVMDKTIEQKVSETILQQPEEITVGEKTYKAAPPSVATLILASEAVSRLPQIKLDTEKVVEESLSVAKDCRALGDIIAILILGAKHLTETVKSRETKEKRYLCGLLRRKHEVEVEVTIDRKAELANEILENISPTNLYILFATLLQKMQIQDFFGLTTFLTEINLLRQTKVD